MGYRHCSSIKHLLSPGQLFEFSAALRVCAGEGGGGGGSTHTLQESLVQCAGGGGGG